MLESFLPATRLWFGEAFAAPTPVQEAGWAAIARHEHALLLAPTGSGKTLAAFLWSLDMLMRLPPDAPAGVRVVYVSPLKALVYDIERNLRGPLAGILRAAERLGQPLRQVGVDIRTGDTPQALRRQQLKRPADILVTTPESLYLLLGGQAAQTLQSCQTIIVDEVHALAPTKRGAHLALSLERLARDVSDDEPQRIGLSATVRPHSEAAQFLGGQRPVTVVDKAAPARIDLRIEVPVPNMERPPVAPSAAPPRPPGGPILGQLARQERQDRPAPSLGRDPTGMWAVLYPKVLELILANRSVIVFVNSRSVCERMAQSLNELAGTNLTRAHHGSLALKKRVEIEEALKAGELRGIVATSSLELGIDMGSVDLVVLVESPGSVSRGLQRVGRAGHQVGELSRGVMLPKYRGDLLECAVVSERMRQGALEPIVVPHNALDVLAQHIVADCARAPRTVADLGTWVRKTFSYQQLSEQALISVLDMLSGTYPSDEFADLRPLLTWDRQTQTLSPRRGARLAAVMNAGTIPDRGLFGVFLAGDGPRVGELDEEMVHESRAGDTFMLGATTWRVEQITRDRVIVTPAPGEPGRMPFWRGEGPGRPVELGRAMGTFVREMADMTQEDAISHLQTKLHLDGNAAHNLWALLDEQRAATGTLPTDTTLVVERFRDEIGDWRVCILSPFGARVHAPWAFALEAMLTKKTGLAVKTMYNDDGIVLRFADSDTTPSLNDVLLDPEEVEEQVVAQLGQSALFASTFRENASRALLMPKMGGRGRTPLWQQRLKGKMLLAAAQRYPSFPIVLETYRQCLRDIFDIPSLMALLQAVQRRDVRIEEVTTQSASPFARGLAFAYTAAYLYEHDAPLAERRAHALTLDRNLLRELLGQADLRALLDATAIDEVQAIVQHEHPEHRARDADELHDVLRRLGDLTTEEIRTRVNDADAPWVEELLRTRRAVQVRVAGEMRIIAAQDAGRYRDALGVMLPSGLPERFIEPTQDALLHLCKRYARTHGPFTAQALVARYKLGQGVTDAALDRLAKEGVLAVGHFTPQATGVELCDTEVLRRIKRATLARLRNEAAAVDGPALAHFLWRWHHLDAPLRGVRGLEEVLGVLGGCVLPWSAWCQAVLPARVADFHPDMLDMLCATGALVWVGRGAMGPKDGRVQLLRRSDAAALLQRLAPDIEPYTPPSPQHASILQHLESRGASFTVELAQAAALGDVQSLDTVLWDLIWAGLITNDTVQPLRALMNRTKALRGTRVNPAMFGGRWSLVKTLCDNPPAPEKCLHQQAVMLLDRYGIVCREVALAEDTPGGFGALYDMYKAMDDAGGVRRGYFVEGLSGAQFAYGFAIERLRADRPRDRDDTPTQVMAVTDPANPYGTLLPWPALSVPKDRAPRRQTGAWLIALQGQPLAYLDARGGALMTFAAASILENAVGHMARGCKLLARFRKTRMVRLTHIDDVPALQSPYAKGMVAAGMAHTFDGLTINAV